MRIKFLILLLLSVFAVGTIGREEVVSNITPRNVTIQQIIQKSQSDAMRAMRVRSSKPFVEKTKIVTDRTKTVAERAKTTAKKAKSTTEISKTKVEKSDKTKKKSSNISKSSYRLLIGVVTAPTHVRAREAIRKSYATESNRATYGFDLKFFVGNLPSDKEHLNDQINQEKNMVRLGGFIESYETLGSKALGIFNWGYDNGYDVVFKVDDDSYVRPQFLRNFLQQHDVSHALCGHMASNVINKSDKRSKWYFRDQYDHDTLPPYAIGAGILVGKDGLKYLSDKRNSLTPYRVDDAGVGIWLKDISPTYIHMNFDIYPYNIRSETVVINPVNYNEMMELSKGVSSHMRLNICETSCLCPDSPNYNEQCVQDFSNSEYKDIILRVAEELAFFLSP